MLSVFKDLVFGTNSMNNCLIVCMELMKEEFDEAVDDAKSFAIEANTVNRIQLHQPNTLRNRARITDCEELMEVFSYNSFHHIINYLWLSEASKCISQMIVSMHDGNKEALKHNQQSLHAIIDMFIKADVVTYSKFIDSAISCSIIDTKTVVRSARKNSIQKIDFAPSSASVASNCQKVCNVINEWKKEKHFEYSTIILANKIYPKYFSCLTVNLELLQMSYLSNVQIEKSEEISRAINNSRFENMEDEENYEDVNVHLSVDEMIENLEQEIK